VPAASGPRRVVISSGSWPGEARHDRRHRRGERSLDPFSRASGVSARCPFQGGWPQIWSLVRSRVRAALSRPTRYYPVITAAPRECWGWAFVARPRIGRRFVGTPMARPLVPLAIIGPKETRSFDRTIKHTDPDYRAPLAPTAGQSYPTTSSDKKTKGQVALPLRAICGVKEGGVRCRHSCAS
jgi:hypothetical protein